MRKTLTALAAMLLAGCATQANLIGADGKRYPASVDTLAQTVTANIDGTQYTGKYVRGGMVGFGTSGYRSTTMYGMSKDATAVLQSASGGVLECGFTAADFSVMGRCRNLQGAEYILTSE